MTEQLTIDFTAEPARPADLPSPKPTGRKAAKSVPVVGALVSESEQPYAVPENWQWVQIGELIQSIGAGKSFACLERPPEFDEVGVCKVSAVTWGEYDEEESKTCTDPEKINPNYFIKPGDFLISRANTIELVGASVIAKSVSKRIMLSDKVLRLKFSENLVQEFLLNFLKTKTGRQAIQEASTGNQMSMRNISQSGIRSILLPLPPLPEQARIVARLESLLGKIREARELIDDSKTSNNNRKAVLINNIFKGPLSGKYKFKSIELGNCITQIQAGKSFLCLERPPENNEIGVLKVSSVTWGEYREEESKTCTDPDKVNSAYFVNEGDFLISRANTIELVGACVITEKITKKIMLSDKILRVQFDENKIIPRFALYYLKSKEGRKQIEDNSSGNQLSMRNISQKSINNIQIPLPSLAEQAEIVRILDHLLALEDQALEQIENMEAELDVLEKSILAKAFRGELGTNDPSEPPVDLAIGAIS